jgi:O-antigen ligase
VLVAITVAAIVTAANASEGGYFSQSWGWIALAFLVPTTVVVILERATVPGRFRIAFAGLMGALAVWIALSSLWSISSSASVREVERMLVYVAVALALALVLRRGDTTAVLAGAGIGISLISGYALVTRLFPDRLGTYDPIVSYRLAEPVGYWNALGLLATMGSLVVLGFVAHARRRLVVAVGGLLVPVLATTLYFTFSRAAWVALGVGLLVTVALDPRRLRYTCCAVVVSLPAIACVTYASHLEALTTEHAPAVAAAREGHRLAFVVVGAAVVCAASALGARFFAAKVPASRLTRRAFDVALAAVAMIAAAAVLIAVGGPVAGVHKIEGRFKSQIVGTVDLNQRLFSISGTGRSSQYRISWNAARDRPIGGYGAGTFEYLWYEHRPDLLVVRDGHSLYLDTLAELGVVGLALLAAALLVLAMGGIRARRARLAASGVAAFIAWVAASAVDWHWEMVGVTLTALVVAGAAMLASERRALPAVTFGTRLGLVGVTGTLSVLAVWSLVGNQALFAGREAVARKNWSDARKDARLARDLLPWSYEPLVVLGDADAGAGNRQGALQAYRDAVDRDPRNWIAWLRLAQVTTGAERAAAYDRVHQLNPRQRNLPGES